MLMFSHRPACFALVLCALSMLPGAREAHAAEQVTLRSGFSVRCTSREAVSASTVRLHLTGSSDNYMDVAASSITAVETVPDEVPNATAATNSNVQRSSVDLQTVFQSSGARHNVNVALLASVVQAESGGNAHAVSRAGAQGLMQLMPGTAASLGVTDSFSAEGNVNGGSAYLDQLLTRYHDNLSLALAAYNAGPAAVDRYRGIPPFRETRLYVAKVIREFNRRVHADTAALAAAAVSTSAPQAIR